LRKLGHLVSFVISYNILREVERERAREKVLKREDFKEQEEDRDSRGWS